MKIPICTVSRLFEYYTPKIVHIKNKRVGFLNRMIQLAICTYVFGYAIYWNRGYQEISELDSAVTTKVKGVVYTNFSADQFSPGILSPEVYQRVWDVSDFVVPSSENSAFFVTTNVIITPNQTQGLCAEDPDVPNAKCEPLRNRCFPGRSLTFGHGVMSGRCIPVDPFSNSSEHTCEIHAWCPLERDIKPMKNRFSSLLEATGDATVLIKNFVEFKLFNIKRRNIPNNISPNYLHSCRYDPEMNYTCPVFRLRDLVQYAGYSYREVSVKGALIAIKVLWSCDLDYDPRRCLPSYRFYRLDKPTEEIASGWNFRYANYYDDKKRTLFKVYGIKFVILVEGRGGRFSVVPLFLNIGSGLGLLAITSILCDLVVLHLLKKKDVYKQVKYEDVSNYLNTPFSHHPPSVQPDKDAQGMYEFGNGRSS